MKNILLVIFLLTSFCISSGEPAIKKVAIIGGGMGGVATAAFLKKSKYQVHLFEKEDHLGGNARSVALPGANNKEVIVDLGPQYFAPGGWDLYIEFLKYFNLYNKENFHKFTPGINIFRSNQKYPDFFSLELSELGFDWLLNKDGGLERLLTMLNFMGKANKFYNNKAKENISVGEFLKDLKISEKYKEEIIKPLIATGLGVPLMTVEDGAMITTTGLIAFRAPLANGEFLVAKKGMQPFIEDIAEKTKKNWNDFYLHLSSSVENIIKNSDGSFDIIYGSGEKLNVDYVVLAIQPPIAKTILKDWEAFNNVWDDFTYKDTRVVIHNDRGFLHPKFQPFYNGKVKDDGECYLAMNLQKISPEYGDLIKSWNLSDQDYRNLKDNGHIVAESHFIHPLTTPRFLEAVDELKQIAKEQGNIFFAGGWTLNWETQETAILSGFLAAKEIDPSIAPYWKEKLSSLKD